MGRSRRALTLMGAGVACVVALVATMVGFASTAEAAEGSITRVVDGDTVDVTVDDERIRVRMLNIDTPETVDPSRPTECLGAAASSYTRSLLPVGTHVRLRFDEERRDRYGRTLAHVVLDDDRVVGDEIARRGLGIPLVVGANDARIASLRSAFAEAAEEKRGFFDPGEDCTIPAQLAQTKDAQAAADAVEPGRSVASADKAWKTASTSSQSVADVRELVSLSGGATPMSVKALRAAGRGAEIVMLRRSLAQLDDATTSLGETLSRRRQKAAALARAKAAQARAARRRAEQERAVAAALAAQREESTRGAPTEPFNDRPSPSSAPRSQAPTVGDLAGYTGPRCYAPGGKSWKPC